MQRLLEDFDNLFDLSYLIGDTPLGELLEQAVSGLDQPSQNWGSEGQRKEVSSERGRFVSFYYHPHLFPGMDLKMRLAHELQYRLLPRELTRTIYGEISSRQDIDKLEDDVTFLAVEL